MPQIVTTPNNQKVPVRMPSGTSWSSSTLHQAVLRSVREVLLGTGTASGLLYQAAIRILGTFSFGSTRASLALQDIHEAVYEEILPTLIELFDLLTWPDGWNGYDAYAPKYDAVQYASHWVRLFYLEIKELCLDWLEPNVTASADGEVVLEWGHGIKKLTIFIGNQNVEYVKDWGADINTEMEDGYINSPDVRRALWKWLIN